ncbi:MAG: cytidine deaminase [Chitinophagales bacterium]|nr:cytidine deaminase [Chitinophagales bacterium]
MKTLTCECHVELYDHYNSFSEAERQLFAAAKAALHNAYAPYSNFQVAAAVWLSDGSIYQGNNQENAAYPSGLCAERVALFYASAIKPDIAPRGIAVTVNYEHHPDFDQIVSPCGGCRQVIAEYEHKFKQPICIYLLGSGTKVAVIRTMSELLPLLFSGDVLKSFSTPK